VFPAVCFLAAIATFAIVAAPAQAESRVVLHKFCTTGGEAAGQCATPKGLAVNLTGAGAAAAGDVYVADSNNKRIDIFDAEGTFLSAFGLNVGGAGVNVCTSSCVSGTASGAAGSVNVPQGIAVDQQTGNVYVTSNANKRVDVFSASGQFQGAFGWKVNAGAPAEELQFCTEATTCQAGANSPGAGGFSTLTPSHPAVDPNTGSLYVPDQGNLRMDQFIPSLNGSDEVVGVSFVRAFGWAVDKTTPEAKLQACTVTTGCQKGTKGGGLGQFRGESPLSAAVDSTGTIYAVSTFGCTAAEPCRVWKFSEDLGSVAEFAPSFLSFTSGTAANQEPLGVVIDPEGDDVLVLKKVGTSEFRLLEFDSSGSFLSASPPTTRSGIPGTGVTNWGLAVGTEGRAYVSTTTGVSVLAPIPPPPIPPAPTCGSPTASEVTCSGTVEIEGNESGEGNETSYRFEYSLAGADSWTPSGQPVLLGETPGTYPVGGTIVGLEPHQSYEFRLALTTAGTVHSQLPNPSVETLAAPPIVVEAFADAVGTTTATLAGRVNPRNSATTYFIEWGTQAELEASGHFANRIPAVGQESVGAGGVPVVVEHPIAGLQPGKTYVFRIVANNPAGPMAGSNQEFTTLNETGLPNDRGLELVSSLDKGPQGQVMKLLSVQIPFQAAADGESIIYPINNGAAGATAGGEVRYLARRGLSGWQSGQLSPPSLVTRPEELNAEPSALRYFGPDLACGLVESVNPLTEDVPPLDREMGVTNLYRLNPDGSYALISNRPPTNATFASKGAPYFKVAGASPDCTRIYFSSPYVLLAGASGLYEWDNGVLRDAGLRPDGTVDSGGVEYTEHPGTIGLGGEAGNTEATRLNAVSADGTRFAFSALSDEGGDAGNRAVFLRKGPGEVVDISLSQGGSHDSLGARYETASADGSHVFFAANYGLTATTSSGPQQVCFNPLLSGAACDLYDYDVETGQLTDLSADANTADTNGASVQGVVAASGDGSYVYFAALGQLVVGKGKTYAENINGPTSINSANLYLAHDHQLTYVATVTEEDLRGSSNGVGGSESGLHGLLIRGEAFWNAEVTPDGRELLLSSEEDLTGYDSNGVQEAYIYFAPSQSQPDGALQCVSCRRDGQPSLNSNDRYTPIPGTAADRNTQLHYRRLMTTDGRRVFFTSADPLAPGAVAGDNNVYEWAGSELGGQVSLINAEPPDQSIPGTPQRAQLYEVSSSGNDVFFVSAKPLVPGDHDEALDLYDARVAGGFPGEEPPAPPCDAAAEGACNVGGTNPPSPTVPATSNFTGPANPPPPKHKKRKHHKKKHKHHKKKHHHQKKKAAGKHGNRSRSTNANRRTVK
jgi:hypothetical protein